MDSNQSIVNNILMLNENLFDIELSECECECIQFLN